MTLRRACISCPSYLRSCGEVIQAPRGGVLAEMRPAYRGHGSSPSAVSKARASWLPWS